MRNIIITGSTSFIGVNLIRELLNKNYNVIALTRKEPSNIEKLPKSEKIKIIQLDMEEITKLPTIINEKCDIFVHLAWNGTRGNDRNNITLQQNNYNQSIDAIKVAHELGCSIFVGAGSQAEYGLYNCEISEVTECKPVTEYGKSKLKVCNDGYELCKKIGINFKWPRFFSLYGVEDYDQTLIISTIDKMLKDETIKLTECIQMWNFLYITDAINGVIKLIETNCSNGVYNFGSNDTRVLKSYIEEMAAITNTKSEIIYGAVPYPQTGMVSVEPNTEKLKKETNWESQTPFREGIKTIILSRKGKNEVRQ